ncbi:MAG TPA: rRNA adenine N-6-methyltransferase family protein [Granulicella sp.]|jgi:protein-L-isoaspartate(D-aspartate) O-methyltransferase|nr:rRNA adenine N-6-methyltransferase family protein [Granulicella sp.]
MIETETVSLTVEQCRWFYAEELRVVANLASAALVGAFARVERERYMGQPPWQFSSQAPNRGMSYRTTEEVRDLYHDIFIALKSEKFLNNGLPSVLAGCLDKLNLAPGQRVLHIGCGSGYYTAIMAEVVGAEGAVVAVELEPELAELAAANLKDYANVTVVNGDGAALAPAPSDVVMVNAGVTHPHPAWLECLAVGGTLLLPLCVGEPGNAGKVLAVRITRQAAGFAADIHSIFALYSSPSLRDPAMQELLFQSVETRKIAGLKSVRVEPHEQTESCIVHAPGFCLSAAAVGASA